MPIYSYYVWIPTRGGVLAKHVKASFEFTASYAVEQTGIWGSRGVKELGWRAKLMSGSARIPTKASRPSPGSHAQNGSWLRYLPCIHIPSSSGTIALTWRRSKIKVCHFVFSNAFLFIDLLYSLVIPDWLLSSVSPISPTLVPQLHADPGFLLNESSQWH